MPQILLIDVDNDLRELQARILRSEGYTTHQAKDIKTGWTILESENISLVLCDFRLLGIDGIAFILAFKSKYPHKEIIIFTADGTITEAVQAMKNGAFDYMIKGRDNIKMLLNVKIASQKAFLQQKVHDLETKLDLRYGFDSIIGNSAAIREAKRLAQKVAATNTTVLLLGETGTGKEIFAQAIYYSSERKHQSFVAVNCGALGKDLLESELFGHTAGAFTGALSEKKGLFEECDKGTIFLDEIGEMSLDLQVKLLRVLENGTFIKVGGIKTLKIDCRVIAATNRNLQKDVYNGLFREDLYYRLSTFVINLPSLRERYGDITILSNYLIKKISRKLNIPLPIIEPSYLEKLESKIWKGNIRELTNTIEGSLILCTGTLSADLLSLDLQKNDILGERLDSVEKRHIQKVLVHARGNKSKTCQILGIGLATLYRKLEKYNI